MLDQVGTTHPQHNRISDTPQDHRGNTLLLKQRLDNINLAITEAAAFHNNGELSQISQLLSQLQEKQDVLGDLTHQTSQAQLSHQEHFERVLHERDDLSYGVIEQLLLKLRASYQHIESLHSDVARLTKQLGQVSTTTQAKQVSTEARSSSFDLQQGSKEPNHSGHPTIKQLARPSLEEDIARFKRQALDLNSEAERLRKDSLQLIASLQVKVEYEEQNRESVEKQLEDALLDVQQLQRQLEDKDATLQALQTEIEYLKQENSELSGEVSRLTHQVALLNDTCDNSKQKVEVLKCDLEQLQKLCEAKETETHKFQLQVERLQQDLDSALQESQCLAATVHERDGLLLELADLRLQNNLLRRALQNVQSETESLQHQLSQLAEQRQQHTSALLRAHAKLETLVDSTDRMELGLRDAIQGRKNIL